MALKQIDGVITDVDESVEAAVKASEYIEKRDDILKDMHDTVKLQSEIDTITENHLGNTIDTNFNSVSSKQKGGYRFHGINTQFKQVSTVTTRQSVRRKFPLGIRMA